VRALVAGARAARLERDAADASPVDGFGRLLVHVFLVGDGGEVLLAEAMIRAGHSPHYVKYGRSRRFDARFRTAEAEARAAGRGIWSGAGPPHYPDYEERLAWWHARADQVDAWRALPAAPHRITLETRDADARLRDAVGREVEVFGTVGGVRADGVPRILWLRNAPAEDLALVVFDADTWGSLPLDAVRRGYVVARGRVTLYKDRPQIVLDDPAQLRVP
jgi:hypothetical protein